MGGSQSTQTGSQVPLGQRVGQAASAAGTALAAAPGAINQAAQTATALTQSVQGLAQALGPAANTLKLAMANVQRQQGATYGGCDCDSYFGGNDDADPAKGLREYESSLSAKAKEDVIRRLARALKRAGINVDPEGDLDEIIRRLVSQIPNPRNGKTFSSDAKAQEKVCRVIADVLNDEFTPGVTKHSEKFIDTSLSAVEICRSVGEWAHSFAAGVNTEFLAVHASVKNALRTIEVLAEIMREIYSKIQAKVERDGDAKFNREFDPLNEVYSRAQVERKKQEELLKNILHVQLAPAAKELEMAMRDESEQNALIKRLGLNPGTSEFADSLASAISGLGTAASIAQRVHKALKQVGVSVRQYLDSAEYADFQRLLDDKIESGAIKADDLAKFIEAMNTLRLAFDDRKESRFREALEESEKSGGGRRRRRHGGGDDEYKSSIDKRVERAKTEKSLIIRDFVGRMSRHYDEVLAAVKSLGPELGKKIPLSDKTDTLRDALVRLRDMREARIELALVGLYSDAAARERKERFLSSLRLVSSTCAALMELEMFRGASSYFARLKAAIDGLEKTVDYFSDVITKKFGGEGDLPDDDEDVEAMYEGGRRHKRGGADEDLLPEIARSALSLNEAVGEFSYFYYVAKVRGNLEQSAKELDIFGEKYVEVLGDAVAARLWNLRQERLAIEGRLTEANRAAGQPLNAIFGATGTAAAPNAQGDAWFAAAKKWVEQEYDMKEKFYKVLQAMDLYMKAFTVGIVKDPDAVRDIKKMLDGTQVIARWFSEETGNFLWKAFEHMGSTNFAGATAAPMAAQAVLADKDAARSHYYQKVHNEVNAGRTTLGIPQIGIPAGGDAPDHAAAAKKSVADALEYFQALKNLVNAFSRIGDRFGGRELRTQVFMSPTQIFKTLMDYMKQSAMSINAGGGAAAPGIIATNIQVPGEVAAPVATGVRPYQVYFGSVQATLQGNYQIEDRYFTLIVKSMAAKILTTLGVYDMFERRTPIYDLTPTRLIVGGADDSDPEVLEGATELYFRLPRLVEFYRGFLRWDGAGQQLKVAMLPELEGIFSGLIRLIFQKMTSPESGDYSDSELRSVVREINLIYNHFHEKSSERAVQAAMNAFIMEINRRYGLIKSDDMTKYWGLVRRARHEGEWGSVNDTNYAILPGEEEIEVDRRAPSDRYTLPGAPAAAAAGLPREFTGRALLDDDINAAGARRMLLRTFRADIEKEFARIPRDQFGTTSFSLLIKQAEAEIRRASGKEAKLSIASKLIQGTNTVSLDANKAFMFHETVVVGLNMVGAIHQFIQNYEAAIDLLNPLVIEGAVTDGLHAGLVGDPPAALDLATISGAGYMNDNLYNRYLIDGTANNLNGNNSLFLSLRGDIGSNVRSAHVYQFWVLEGTFARANAGRLPNPPSTYTTPEAVAKLTEPQRRNIRAMRLVARLLTNYPLMMREYVETIFALSNSSGGLVEVRFLQGASSQIQVNFSKLRGLAESILSDVKYYIDLFRPFIPSATIARFENRENVGSVFWLEENLVDPRFRGRTEDPADQDVTLDGLARRTSGAFSALVRDTQVALGATINAGANNSLIDADDARRAAASIIAPIPANANTRVETYGNSVSALLWYTASESNSGYPAVAAGVAVAAVPAAGAAPIAAVAALPAAGMADQYALGGLIATARAQANLAAPLPQADGAAANRFLLYEDAGTHTGQRSLMMAFNQVLARYLSVLTDPSGPRKIYINLINAFANGVAARAVTNPVGNSFPDVAAPGQNFGRRGDPQLGAVIYQSLAWVLQRLVKDVNPTTQVADHLVSTLTDVPLYLKESYRVNLPGFIRLFDLIVQKGDFIKQLIQKTSIDCRRPNLQAICLVGGGIKIRSGNAIPDDGVRYPLNSLTALRGIDLALNSDAMKVRAAEVIDAVSTAAYTLSSSASEVLKELADQPVYLQTQEGSIETYKLRYGKLPLMPLSFTLYFLNDIPAGDDKLYPKVSLGDPQFKLQYGVRGLLIRQGPVELDVMPGVKAALEAYNGVSAKREQLDPARYLSFVKNVVSSLRYFTESRNYKGLLSTFAGLFSTQPLLAAVGVGQAIELWNNVAGNSSYALGKTAQPLVTAVESSNQEEEMNKIVAVAGGAGGAAGAGGNRRLERILNLVDMNVIPINVHALMRDVPLANLYNYEYTFEQMAAALYGEMASSYTDRLDTKNYVTDARTLQTRQMFLRMLVDPYLNLDATNVAQGQKLYGSDVLDLGTGGFVHRIFRGDNNLGLVRPKFLSDQLFNKVLFGSTYQTTEDFDEAGPGVGAGISRGRANVGLRAANIARQHVFKGVRLLETLLAYLQAAAAAAAAADGAGSMLDDGAGGDAAIDAMLAGPALAGAAETPAQMITRVIGEALAEYGAARAITGPLTAGNPIVTAVDNELQAQVAAAAGANGVAVGTNLQGSLADVAAGGARIRMAFDALRGATQAGAVNTVARVARQLQLLSGVAGNNAHTIDAVARIIANVQQAVPLLPAQDVEWARQGGRRAQIISFLSVPAAGGEAAVVELDLGNALRKAILECVGRMRFDTRLVRNIFFITNVLRLVRLKLNRELTQSRSVLVSSHSAVAPSVTEYGADPFGPNEILASTLPNGMARFNDRDAF